MLGPTEFTQEPDFGQSPVPHHRLFRHLQYFRSFLDIETAKESQLHHATLSLIDQSETLQCIIQRDQIGVRLRSDYERLIKR